MRILRPLRLLTVAAVLVTLGLVAAVAPAGAAGGETGSAPAVSTSLTLFGPCPGGATVDNIGGQVVWCDTTIDPGDSPYPGRAICFLGAFPQSSIDFLQLGPAEPGLYWGAYFCDDDGDNVYTQASWPYQYPGGPGVDPVALRNEIFERIEPDRPPAVSAPPFDGPSTAIVVNIPTWLWLDRGYWQPITEGETQGGVTVTVTATPDEARWTMGDNTVVTCNDDGEVWAPGRSDGSTDCFHTYARPSVRESGLTYDGNVAVDWDFTWSLNGAPQGYFGTVTVDQDLAIRVGEIQALNTTGG